VFLLVLGWLIKKIVFFAIMFFSVGHRLETDQQIIFLCHINFLLTSIIYHLNIFLFFCQAKKNRKYSPIPGRELFWSTDTNEAFKSPLHSHNGKETEAPKLVRKK